MIACYFHYVWHARAAREDRRLVVGLGFTEESALEDFWTLWRQG